MGLDLRLLAPATVAWIGVLVCLRLSPAVVAVVAGVLTAAGVVVLLAERRGADPRVLVIGLCCAAAALTLVSTAAHQATRSAGPVVHLAERRAAVSVEAVVTSDPRTLPAAGPGRTGPMVLVRLSIRQVVGRGQVSTPRTPVLLFADARWLDVRWHQRVRAQIRLAPPKEKGSEVEAVASAQSPPVVVAQPGVITRSIDAVRGDLRTATDPLPADPRGLVPALVIGDTSRVPPALDDDMRATGMTHLNAVSGSNVTVVLMAVLWACGWLRVPRRWRLPCCLGALVLFVLLCRPEPSVVRATAMGVVGLLGTTLARPHAAPAALSAAVIGLLCIDPWLASSYGFALSALATLGLILFARPWGSWFARFLPERLRPLADAVAIPVAAQAVCAPVIVLLQGSVSVVGVPANLLAAPLVAPATVAGVVTVLVAPLSTTAALLPAWLAGLPAWGIAAVAHAFAALPFGALPWPDGAAGAFLLAGITLGLLLCAPALAVRAVRRPVLAMAVTVLVAAAFAPLPPVGWPAGGWVYVACDVGQGDGGVLRTGDRSGVLVDAGPDGEAIDRCLSRLGITRLDAVLLTHFHADHVDGLAGALHDRSVGVIFTNGVHDTGSSGARDEPSQEPEVDRQAAAAGVPVHALEAGQQLQWGAVTARVLWPARVIHEGSVQNNASVVLDVRSGGLRILLLGDAEREAQAQVRRALSGDPDRTPFSVLKVAHHGSSNQDPELMHLVRAPVAVISVGAGNDYGHPAPRTLDLMRDSGSMVVRTDRGGDVAVVGRHGRPFIARP
ncbi:ComEC/Rec2 family competence protein [Luteipulveratus flavus]|uniref:ComEC/Rec2 family competence protein n=1 Tax=Luteipulveratus flavus TaxID=3031728 RepID=A0ABT6C944_9MICO|nr:ComEC/Rec2 family competence protein [Luteipulveratus sp. YIM 133296]MDF8265251.1 ComEC/Rec2 family competence protein [Luteipulveratus sp. YIM 133296]